MKRTLAIIVIGLGVVLLAMVNYSTLAGLWGQSTVPAEVVAEAKSKVKEPVLPPPPTSTTEVEGYDEKYVEMQVPEFSGFPPQITMRTQRVMVGREPRVRIKNPSSEDVTRWEAEKARLSGQYRAALQEQIDLIRARRSKELRETLESWVKIVGGAIGCLAGCVGLVVTIRKERRESLAAATKDLVPSAGKSAVQQAAAPDGARKVNLAGRQKRGRRG